MSVAATQDRASYAQGSCWAGLLCAGVVVESSARLGVIHVPGPQWTRQPELAVVKVAEFLVKAGLSSQVPSFWCAGICAAFMAEVRKDKRMLFLVTTSVPVILFFALSPLRKTAYELELRWPM